MRAIKYLFLIFTAISLVSCVAARKAVADKQTLVWRYEIEPTAGQATQGSVLVKVWTYSKSRYVATTQAGKNAVHGIIFKGVSALNNGSSRIPAQRPLVSDLSVETTYRDYLTSFFRDGGKYQKYVNFVNNGIPEPGDIIKIRNEYKIGVTVSVAKDALRKELEEAGIIQKLGAGF